MSTITIYDYSEEWDEPSGYGPSHPDRIRLVVPSKVEVCPTCRGKGQHSLAIGAITQEDRERDWSDDEFQDYMDGFYDRQCETCRGLRVVDEPDWDAMTPFQAELADRWYQDEADYQAVCAAERRMGC